MTGQWMTLAGGKYSVRTTEPYGQAEFLWHGEPWPAKEGSYLGDSFFYALLWDYERIMDISQDDLTDTIAQFWSATDSPESAARAVLALIKGGK